MKDWTFFLVVLVGLVGGCLGYLLQKNQHRKNLTAKEREFDARLPDVRRAALAQYAQEVRVEVGKEFATKEVFLIELRQSFDDSYVSGRKWLAKYIADIDLTRDSSAELAFRYKNRPARSAADDVRDARAERRKWKETAKYLEFQLESLKEYFPEIEEYEDALLNEEFKGAASFTELAESADRVRTFLTDSEYQKEPESCWWATDSVVSARVFGPLVQHFVQHLNPNCSATKAT